MTDGSRRRLSLFTFEYPPVGGGISRLCGEAALALRRRGVEVRVVSQGAVTRRPWRELSAWARLAVGRTDDPLLCGIWYPEGLLAQLSGAPNRVVLAHGSELFDPPEPWRRPVWRRLRQRVLGSARVVVANSRYTQALVKQVAPGAEVTWIPLGVDERRFSPGDTPAAKQTWGVAGKRVLLSVSRVEAYKGHEMVLAALARLSGSERSQLVYLVAGTGPHLEALREKIRSLGLDEQVRCLGNVLEVDLPTLYRAADLFVLCTQERPASQAVEGFGLVFLEAQASGVPVVGTRTGGIADAVEPGEGGWLIAEDDQQALTSICRRLVETPAEFVHQGQRARRRVERVGTWDRWAGRLDDELRARGLGRAA